MRISARGVLRAGLVSFAFGLLLIFLLAMMATGLGAAGVSLTTVKVIGFVVGFLTRMYAGLVGGRKARDEELDRREVVLSATLGCGAGFFALQLANMFAQVIVLQSELTFAWSMLYDVVPWMVAGGLGGLVAARSRRRRRARAKSSKSAQTY